MPKITKTDDGGWAYKCTCGVDRVLYLDKGEKPKKLMKCFECMKKEKIIVDANEYFGESGGMGI